MTSVVNAPKAALRALMKALVLQGILLAGFPAQSQQHQFTNYTELNGLPSSETYHVFQDRLGFVWIGSDNGVVRFDGGNMEVFNRSTGLTDNTVFGFYEDLKGRVWFRTYSGALSFYNEGSIHTYQYNNVLQEKLRMSLINKLVVGENRLWFATAGQGPAGYVDSIGNIKLIEAQIDPYADAVLFLHAVEGNELLTGFIGTPRLTSSIRINGKDYPIEIDRSFQNSPVAQAVQLGDRIYIAVNKTLFVFEGGKISKLASFDNAVINLSVDRQQNIWVGFFGGGVRKYQGGDFSRWTALQELEGRSVSSTLHDSEGGYWFSTLDKGVFYFPNLDITTRELGGGSKISVVVETPGAVYTGDYAGHVMVNAGASGESRLLWQENTPISALFLDKQGCLWGASASGYFRMSPQRKMIFQKKSLQSIRGFLHDANGAVRAYNSSALYSFNDTGDMVSRVNLGKRPTNIVFADSIIYLGSLYGLERLKPDLTPIDSSIYLVPGRISAIAALGPHMVLVGTIGQGAYIIRHGKLTRLDESMGFNAENVYAILVTDRQVWLGTESGIAISDLEAIRASKFSWRRISRASGLLSDKCNFIAKTGDRMLVFSDQGNSSFPVAMATYLNDKPRAYVRSVWVNNQEMQPGELELDASRNNISIHTGAVSFNNRKLFLRHRLKPDADWNYDTEWNISYYAMTPGEYEVEIEASVDKTNWYGTGNVVAIRIDVPWWKTWLFQLAVGVALIAIGFLLYRLRLSAIRRRQSYLELINSHQQRLIDSEIRTQERERKRIATDLHDGVGTSLSSIKLMLSDSLNVDEKERAARIHDINENLGDVIAEIKRIIYDLHPPALERYGLQVGIKNLVQRINNHGRISVKFDFYGQRELSPQLSMMVYRIIQELITNTIKHARASEIRIHINQFDDEMNIMYEDNGIGMVGSLFDGLGLMNVESRVRTLNGKMSWESNHKGTFYNFDIPF